MSRLGSSSRFSRQGSNIGLKKPEFGIVLDVVTNIDSDSIFDFDFDIENKDKIDTRNTSIIGSCKIKLLTDVTSNIQDLTFTPPLDYLNVDLPIIGETVEVLTLASNEQVYRRVSSPQINIGNAIEDVNKVLFPETEDSNTTSDYKETSGTGTPNSSAEEASIENEYFEQTKINPLQFHEGDKLIQSRFGQSIRFSGYNNVDNVLAPTIIIRNRQGDKSLKDLKIGEPTFEDIVDDGSSIVLSSGEHLLEFTPGTVDTPLETEPIYAEEPELKGTDQTLINSGRIILSSKDSEMLFYSKGNYSFISDGKLTIDNGLDGADMDSNGDVLITTNDNNVSILGGTGEIYLNTEESEQPLVRGQVLVELMEELIDTINAQIFSTPAGPTAMGPNNRSDFNSIKSKLNDFLSTLNYTE